MTSSRDTQEIFPPAGAEMLKIFQEYPLKGSIFDQMSPEERTMILQKGQQNKIQANIQNQIQQNNLSMNQLNIQNNKLKEDYENIIKDLKLIILTFKVLFMRESTEGFDASANENIKKPDIKIKNEGDI